MTPGEVRALEDRICLTYPKLLPAEAHRRTQRVPGITAYRCPFGRGHWHAQLFPPDLLVLAARMVRERNGGESSIASGSQAG